MMMVMLMFVYFKPSFQAVDFPLFFFVVSDENAIR